MILKIRILALCCELLYLIVITRFLRLRSGWMLFAVNSTWYMLLLRICNRMSQHNNCGWICLSRSLPWSCTPIMVTLRPLNQSLGTLEPQASLIIMDTPLFSWGPYDKAFMLAIGCVWRFCNFHSILSKCAWQQQSSFGSIRTKFKEYISWILFFWRSRRGKTHNKTKLTT